MPIGKNSIKRVQNNGYSKVKTDAPDMENSVIAEATEAQPLPKKATAKKASARKPAAKAADKPVAKKPATKKAPKPEEPKTEQATREGDGYVNLGGKLPVHLL